MAHKQKKDSKVITKIKLYHYKSNPFSLICYHDTYYNSDHGNDDGTAIMVTMVL